MTRIVLLAGLALAGCKGGTTEPKVTPQGAEQRPSTAGLEASANLLQDAAPPKQLGLYLNGFHVMKDDPSLHMEAQHYCRERNEEFTQCAIFDGNTAEANLIGVEYIISERLFETLPPEERGYWHPHNYEILSGQLVAPGVPDVAEKALLERKMNSYGKTWHLWDTGHVGHSPAHPLPVGPALIAWSYNGDGEMPQAAERERDRRLGVNTAQKRKARQELVPLARPQEGVDALKGKLPRSGQPEGVRQK